MNVPIEPVGGRYRFEGFGKCRDRQGIGCLKSDAHKETPCRGIAILRVFNDIAVLASD